MPRNANNQGGTALRQADEEQVALLVDDRASANDIVLGTPRDSETPEGDQTPTPNGPINDSSSSNNLKYTSKKEHEEIDGESTHFMTIFEHFDCSFLIVIFICNFA